MDFSVIDSYLENNIQKLKDDLGAVVAIPSKRGSREEGKPFGRACALVMSKMKEIAADTGLSVTNYDNYMLECDYNNCETALGVIAHLDVVPEGDGWDTDPYTLTEKDGILYGRGTIDDKGPAMATLYAVKALKNSGVKLSKNVRLLFGSDEESGMSDLEYYGNLKPLPPMMISPDGEFPVINVEKGVCQVYFKGAYLPEDALVSLKAGSVVNAVPDKAEAVISGLSVEEAKTLAANAGVSLKLNITACDKGVKIRANGVSAHGSTPEKGDNALTGLIKVLPAMGVNGKGLYALAAQLYSLFPYGETDGKSADLKMSDVNSGPLTALFSMLNAENGLISGGIDIRFPATVSLATVKNIVTEKLSPFNFELSFHEMEGHLVPSGSDFVRTLLDCYTQVTGDEGFCKAEGGATYLHNVSGGVAYGAEMPGEENNMHGSNEHIKIDTLLNVAKIYARAIYRLCK